MNAMDNAPHLAAARDADPAETREWIESLKSRRRGERPRARALSPQPPGGAGPATRPHRPRPALLGLPQHDPLRAAAPPIRATSRSRSGSPRSSAGTRSPWCSAPTRPTATSAAISRATPRRRRSSRPASTTISGAPTPPGGGDLVYFQPHSAPGVYARAYLEGRLTEDQLSRYRQEVGGGGLSSYPHPWLMPDFWQVPTGSMGLGPISAIYQARFLRYIQHRGPRGHGVAPGLGRVRRRGDGRA